MKTIRFLLLLLLCLAPLSHAEGFLDRLPRLGGAKQPTFLPPDQAFGLDVIARDGNTLIASLRITPGYYLYRDKTTFSLAGDAANTADIKISNLVMPKGN